MINSKKELAYYLECDKVALGKKHPRICLAELR